MSGGGEGIGDGVSEEGEQDILTRENKIFDTRSERKEPCDHVESSHVESSHVISKKIQM